MNNTINLNNQNITEDSTQEPEYIDSFGIFTIEQVQKLKEESDIDFNTQRTLRKIYTPLFQVNGIRTLAELTQSSDKRKQDLADEIIGYFLKIQEQVLTKKKYITTKTGKTIAEETPYYDYRNSDRVDSKLRQMLETVDVLPDYDLIRSSLLPDNWERATELLRHITKYYIFDKPEQFVDQFSLLCSNAKSKALGIHPREPILFAIYGNQHLGKGWFANRVIRSFDKVFFTRSAKGNYNSLFGDFNSVMMTRGFVHIDEKVGLDFEKCEKFKNHVSEEEVSVNRKNRDEKTIPNLVTMFSTANESIIDLLGYQTNRRIAENKLIGKTGEMPENELVDIMTELWKIIPIKNPVESKVINDLMAESKLSNDAKISEIVVELFDRFEEDFCNGQSINQHQLKESIKKLGGTRVNTVLQWMEEKRIVYSYNRHLRLSKKELSKLRTELHNLSLVEDEEDCSHDVLDIDKM